MRTLGAIILVAVLPCATAPPAEGKPRSANELLRKAEAIRNPDLDYAVDFTIHGVSHKDPVSERDATYSMLAGGRDRTLILMRTPRNLFGALVMMVEGKYWMLLPKATRTWELSDMQMQSGDVGTGYVARVNLLRGFQAKLLGEEALDGEACFKLSLTPEDASSRYGRVEYWLAKSGFFPRKIDFYARTDKLAKSVRYLDYRKGVLGLRSMTLAIESSDDWEETSTLSFVNLRTLDPALVAFSQEGMMALRDAAVAAHESSGADDVPLERVLAAHP